MLHTFGTEHRSILGKLKQIEIQMQFTESGRKKETNSFYESWMASQLSGWELLSSAIWCCFYWRFERNVDSEGRQIIPQCLGIVTQNNKALDNFTFMWPFIVTNFFVIKPTRFANFTNLFCHETLHVSESSSVHHQEFIHCTLSSGICHTGL